MALREHVRLIWAPRNRPRIEVRMLVRVNRRYLSSGCFCGRNSRCTFSPHSDLRLQGKAIQVSAPELGFWSLHAFPFQASSALGQQHGIPPGQMSWRAFRSRRQWLSPLGLRCTDLWLTEDLILTGWLSVGAAMLVLRAWLAATANAA